MVGAVMPAGLQAFQSNQRHQKKTSHDRGLICSSGTKGQYRLNASPTKKNQATKIAAMMIAGKLREMNLRAFTNHHSVGSGIL
jgi:hypothetical protein